MPFKSKKQWNKFFAMANRGEISKKKAKEWARETKTPYSKLPRKKEAALLQLAADLGRLRAYHEAGIPGIKEASAKRLANLLPILLPFSAGAAIGAGTANLLTGSIADQIRDRIADMPDPLIAEMMTRGMPPQAASHILFSD